jgi:iron complex transport system substrate-binding protein
MRPGVALLLASWALVAPACGFKPEPIGALPEFPQEVTDGLGRHLTVEAQPQRIASLDAGLTESAFAIGAGPLVVAASGQERYPAAARELPALVTENGEVRLESLVAAQPDVVLAPPGIGEARLRAIARRTGAGVYVASIGSVDGAQHDLLELGLMTGRAPRARRLVAAMEQREQAVIQAVAGDPPVRVFVDRGYFYTISPESLGARLIEHAGGENVAAGADPARSYPIRRLRAARPQVYLALTTAGTTLAGLRRSPATRTLPAVRNHRFALIAPAVLSDTGPRVIDSLETIARALHPDLAVAGQ